MTLEELKSGVFKLFGWNGSSKQKKSEFEERWKSKQLNANRAWR